MQALAFLIDLIVTAIWWLVLIYVILSWLTAFNVVNMHNPIVRQISDAVAALVEPMLAPIRRLLPNVGGIDFSPLVLLVAVIVVQKLVYEYVLPQMV